MNEDIGKKAGKVAADIELTELDVNEKHVPEEVVEKTVDEECPVCRTTTVEGEQRLSHHNEKTVRELVNRMNRIEGQVRGIKGMIERHAYCDDVLNQISSAQSALNGVSKLLLEKHLKSCVQEQLRDGNDEVVDEVLQTIFRMMK